MIQRTSSLLKVSLSNLDLARKVIIRLAVPGLEFLLAAAALAAVSVSLAPWAMALARPGHAGLINPLMIDPSRRVLRLDLEHGWPLTSF